MYSVKVTFRVQIVELCFRQISKSESTHRDLGEKPIIHPCDICCLLTTGTESQITSFLFFSETMWGSGII